MTIRFKFIEFLEICILNAVDENKQKKYESNSFNFKFV